MVGIEPTTYPYAFEGNRTPLNIGRQPIATAIMRRRRMFSILWFNVQVTEN